MATKWEDVRGTFSAKDEADIHAYVTGEVRKIRLAELRKALEMTQAQLAQRMKINQGEVSKIEKRADMLLSTMRSFVQSMGGELHLQAEFPGQGTFLIEDFKSLSSRTHGRKPTSKKSRSRTARELSRVRGPALQIRKRA